jgi:hypothetical protein
MGFLVRLNTLTKRKRKNLKLGNIMFVSLKGERKWQM